MLEPDPTQQQHIAKLEDALRGVERWSFETATDLTAAGYSQWAQLVPREPTAESEIVPLSADQPDSYELDQDANMFLRAAIDGSAAAIQALAMSFHPRRGDAGLRRDLDRAKGIVKAVYDDIQRAQTTLNKKSDRLTH
jgi:hypothetical protein